jgi:hypothetical protein
MNRLISFSTQRGNFLGGLKLHGVFGLVYMAISAGFLLQTSHFGANQPKDLPSTRNFN